MAFKDGLATFLATWSGVHTAYSFNNTDANTGTDTTHDANSSTYDQADTDNYPNYGLAATCSPDTSGNMDNYIITDACMLLYIPADLTHSQVRGIFHNGGGTHAQAGFLRATTTGVEICCTHNAGGTPQDNVIYEIPDALLPGWFMVGFQYCSAGSSQGDMALWINGEKVRSGTRTAQLQYGSGNPQIGDSNADHPLQSACLDPSDYSGGNWGAEGTINGTGILIANMVVDNPNDDNSSPDGNGDTFYTDYFDAHDDSAVEGWYDGDWSYRVKITVQASEIDTTLSNFPVYVDLNDLPAGFHSNCNQTDARDIRVTTDDGETEVPREVVYYDSGTDTGELHFLASSLSSSEDTEFYIYYGNSGASDYADDATYGAENVWVTYESVWHLGEASGTIYDSAGNHDSTAENINAYAQTGQLGKCIQLAGNTDDTDSVDFGDVLDMRTNDMTISAWYKSSDTGTGTSWIVSKSFYGAQNYRYGMGFDTGTTDKKLRAFMQGDGGTDAVASSSTQANDGNWQLGHDVFDRSGNVDVYINGATESASQDISGWVSADMNSSNPFKIGAYTENDNSTSKLAFDGYLEEIRVTMTALSAGWIDAEHTNQSDSTTFYDIGSQEEPSGGTEADSERSLYIQGSIEQNSERNLYISGQESLCTDYVSITFGGTEADSERLLYIEGCNTGDSERNLYLAGQSSGNSERNIYIQGQSTGNSERGLYISGYIETYSERALYIIGQSSGNSERTIYINGYIETYGERLIYI